MTVTGCGMKPVLLLQQRCECCLLHPLDIEATFAVLGHNPNICHLLYHISPGSLTKKNNTCTVFRGRERMREYGGKGGTKRERHLIIYALSCERQQKSARVWEKKKKKKGGKRPREWLCVCKRDISVTFCLAKSPIWLRNEEGWSDGG